MKKFLHFVVFVALLLSATTLRAQSELGNVLVESFENGIPTTWTNEQVFGDFKWTVKYVISR